VGKNFNLRVCVVSAGFVLPWPYAQNVDTSKKNTSALFIEKDFKIFHFVILSRKVADDAYRIKSMV